MRTETVHVFAPRDAGRDLESAERALATRPHLEEAQELVDLPPLLGMHAALLAEESFRDLLAAVANSTSVNVGMSVTFTIYDEDGNVVRTGTVVTPGVGLPTTCLWSAGFRACDVSREG